MLVFSLQGFKLLKYKMAVREIFEPLIRLILVAIVLAAGWKLPAVFLAYLLTSISALFLAFYFVKKVFPRITDRQLLPVYETRKLFAFSWPLLFIFFFGSLLLWTDTVILALFRTSTEVGIYGATQRTALLCSIIITAFNSIFAPIAADLSSRGQRTQLETLFKTVTKWTLLTSSPLCIGFFLFPGEILGIFGVRFTEGRVSLIILSVAWLLHSAMSSAGLLLTMSGRSRLQLVNASLLLLANIVLNFLLIPGLGAKGAALATAISIILFDIVSVIEVAMIAKMIPFRMDFFKVLAAGGIMLSAGMAILKFKWIPLPPLAGALLVFTVVFFVYLLVIWILGIGKEERLVLKDLLRRLGKSAPFLSH